ncbi:MAG TPA: DUF3891 family protein [Candidatus Angelobacter sp.]
MPAWDAVLRTQTLKYESCWMITQPSHAALAGELAATVSATQFPAPDTQLLQAISLHDAGWGIPDAQAIMKSRSVRPQEPPSFVTATAPQFVEAWSNSIDTCEPISAAGGYIVSRHFWRLAQERLNSMPEENRLDRGPQRAPSLRTAGVEDRGPQRAPSLRTAGVEDRRNLDAFLKNETRRQKKLGGGQPLAIEQLELLTDLLQFCDLLSLYICCGASESVTFPEYFGVRLRVSNQDESYKLDPPVLKSGAQLSVAALRYPATKEESSRQIKIRIE